MFKHTTKKTRDGIQHVIDADCACTDCNATGLYVGMAERGGAAVVCNGCKGSGREALHYEWTEFVARKQRKGITTVVEVNPGICISPEIDIGGMPYQDWAAGNLFPPKSENRQYTCPAWWYQSADYDRKPEWKECHGLGGAFSDCKHFCEKAKCWERFDREQPKRKRG